MAALSMSGVSVLVLRAARCGVRPRRASNEGALTAWFQKMGFPVDYIAPVEFEGDGGTVSDA